MFEGLRELLCSVAIRRYDTRREFLFYDCEKTGSLHSSLGEKPYRSLDYEWKKQYGEKIYKVSLNGGMTCPNRDGTVGSGGCIFCSAGRKR